MTVDYIVGLDLAQVADFTAVAALEVPVWVRDEETRRLFRAPAVGWVSPERLDPAHVAALRGGAYGQPPDQAPLNLRHLDRWRGVSYPQQVRRIAALMDTPPFRGRAVVVVDRTGVGRPVLDELREAGLAPVGITLTGGDAVSRDGGDFRVPKRDVVSALQVLMMQGRLRIPRLMPHAAALVAELENFRLTINLATGHDSYEAWREHEHDDLVLAACLAAWYWRHEAGTVPGFAGRMCPQGHIGCDLPIAACERVAREERAAPAGQRVTRARLGVGYDR